MTIKGGADFVIWASGSGVQRTTTFTFFLGLNDQLPNDGYSTTSQSLTSSPKMFSASGEVDLELTDGDILTLWVYTTHRGTGAEVLFDNIEFQSGVTLPVDPLYIGQRALVKGGKQIAVEATISSGWGPDDIGTISVKIIGPFSSRDFEIDLLNIPQDKVLAEAQESEIVVVDSDETSKTITWTWQSGEGRIEPGVYYIVMTVTDTGGRNYYDDSIAVIGTGSEGLFGGTTGLVMLALIVGGAAAVAYFFALRSGWIKTKEVRTLATITTVSIVVVAGLFIFATLVPLIGSGGGEVASDIELTSIDGEGFTLSEQRGKVVVMNFMATWCPSCNAEMPELVEFHGNNPDVEMICIDVDPTESDGDLQAFKEKHGADWLHAFDTDEAWRKYQAPSEPYIPTTVVINPDGKITARVVGDISAKELEEKTEAARSGKVDVNAVTNSGSIYTIAFLTGALSFFAPCAFPLLPGYIGYYMGSKQDVAAHETRAKGSTRRAITGGMVAAIGIIAIFSVVGIIVALAGSGIASNVIYIAPIITTIMAIMGLLMFLDIKGPTYRMQQVISPLTSRVENGLSKAFRSEEKKGSYSGLFGYGLAYGIAVMGCQAPVFIALMVGAFITGGMGSAFLVFLMFGIGMGILIIIVTILVSRAKMVVLEKMKQAMPTISKISGLILLIAGVYLTVYYILAL